MLAGVEKEGSPLRTSSVESPPAKSHNDDDDRWCWQSNDDLVDLWWINVQMAILVDCCLANYRINDFHKLHSNIRFSNHILAFSGLVLRTLRESSQPSCPDQNIEELASSSFVLSAHSLRTWRQILGDVEGKFLNIWCHQTATKAQFMLPAKSFAGKCFALWTGFRMPMDPCWGLEWNNGTSWSQIKTWRQGASAVEWEPPVLTTSRMIEWVLGVCMFYMTLGQT